MPSRFIGFAAASLVMALSSTVCVAETIYVDNVYGADSYDGTAERPYEVLVGPFRTIRKALLTAEAGDTIVLANSGTPYREAVNLFGANHSALGNTTFRIIGNGAVLDGTEPVPPDAWKKHAGRVWKMTPYRKGNYLLFREDKVLPEVVVSPGAAELPEIPDGQWCAWRESIYYGAAEREFPSEQPLRFAKRGAGITMYRVHGVEIVDLTIRGYRDNGVYAEDLCSDILLSGITTQHNGGTGITVDGASRAAIVNCTVTENRRASLFLSRLADVDVTGGSIAPEPSFEE